jgi:hypothetical protein
LTSVVLAWLVQHGRRVINGPPALDLEVSKVRQYAALAQAGVKTPRTVAIVGKQLLEGEGAGGAGEEQVAEHQRRDRVAAGERPHQAFPQEHLPPGKVALLHAVNWRVVEGSVHRSGRGCPRALGEEIRHGVHHGLLSLQS